MMSAWVYILRLRSGGLYVGATTNLDGRLKDHLKGIGARATSLDQPVELAYSELYENFSEARMREAQVKRWTRSKKEALISGNIEALRNLAKRRKR